MSTNKRWVRKATEALLDLTCCAGGTRAYLKFGETNLRVLNYNLMKRKPKNEIVGVVFFSQESRI